MGFSDRKAEQDVSRPEQPLVEVRDLKTCFYSRDGVAKAVDGVTLELRRGETLGVVGESGCGKSATALSMMRLIQEPAGRIVSGQVLLKGRDLLQLSEEEMCGVRGDDMAMIFQEPMTSLNPVLTCGYQVMEAIILHQKVSKKEARRRAVEMLQLVGIPAPQQRIDEYPHQMSGGMRQRVMIAMALSCHPEVLIADEPTTALDVTIQAQILELLRRLQEELHMAVILITHDLGVVAEVADRVAVMYAGRIVESAETTSIFESPAHPYTQGLLRSIPGAVRRERLETIPGTVPDARELPPGCRFHPRCPIAVEKCLDEEPQLEQFDRNHQVSCWQARASQ